MPTDIANFLTKMILRYDFKSIAEIGVLRGHSTKQILANLSDHEYQLYHYYLVDPWRVYDGPGAGTLAKVNQDQWNEMYHECLKIQQDNICISLVRKESHAGAELVPDSSLDMVFIDANHDYENCKRDIQAWWPKIKPGGFISGHDYSTRFPGVQKAVNEWLSNPYFLGSIWYQQI